MCLTLYLFLIIQSPLLAFLFYNRPKTPKEVIGLVFNEEMVSLYKHDLVDVRKRNSNMEMYTTHKLLLVVNQILDMADVNEDAKITLEDLYKEPFASVDQYELLVELCDQRSIFLHRLLSDLKANIESQKYVINLVICCVY